MMDLQERLEKLELIVQYNKIEPLYKQAIQQFKNELLESNKSADLLDLPNGKQLLLKRKKAYQKNEFQKKKFKEANPELYDSFCELITIAETVLVSVISDDETE